MSCLGRFVFLGLQLRPFRASSRRFLPSVPFTEQHKNHMMKITSQLDYEVILANRPRPVYFALQFAAPHLEQARPQPAAFCIVLDRSGSMQGPPLAKAKQAAQLAVRNLRPGDQFSLVVFDNEAQIQVPLQSVADKEKIINLIEGIHTGGSTNLTGGWMLGRDELARSVGGATRRLLMLSDGQLNHGVVEPLAVRQIVAAGLETQSIRTSCLGFGESYNEDLMTSLAQVTNGQFYDADSPEKFPGIFESELEGLQKIVVQNLRVRLRKLDFCESMKPLGNYTSVARPGGWVEYAVGDLVCDETRVACFSLDVLPLPWLDGQPVASLEGERLLELEVLFDEIGEKEVASRSFTQVVRIQATQDPAEVRQTVEVIPWVAMQRAGKVLDEVTRFMDMGEHGQAVALLRQTMDALGEYGPNAPVGEALKLLQGLMNRIEQGDWSIRERKHSKYMSHSLRKMSSSERWSSSEPSPSFKHGPKHPPSQQPPPAGGSIT